MWLLIYDKITGSYFMCSFCVLNADKNCQMRWQKKANKPKGQLAHTQAALNERKADGKM
jgi:hypothetical protein